VRRRLRTSPLAYVAAIAVLAALVRFGAALYVRTPIIYPDEYLYTALSRALAHGRFAEIRGGHISLRTTTAYLAPALMAPLWIVSGVGVAYRLCQALGSVAFAAAAFPAYGLARRLGISARGSVATALLTVAVPAGVFTSMLLSEPYAYPLFLLAVFAAVEAIAKPGLARSLGALASGALLCIAGGSQFLYFVPAFLATYLLVGASSVRAYLVRAAIVAGGAAYLVHAVEARGIVRLNYPIGTLASWFAVNLFAFAVGAGWVVVPGGLVGLGALIRRGDRRGRAFALLSSLLLCAMVLEATVWSASGQGIYERFAFYAAPLVVIAFIWIIESGTLVRGHVAGFAYLAALGAALLPALPPLHGAYDEHAPSIHALSDLTVAGRSASIVWSPVLVVLALLVAWKGATARRTMVLGGIAICILLSVGSALAYERHQADSAFPDIHAPSNSALVTWADADPYSMMQYLFWNPEIARVVVLGAPHAPDGLPFTAARLGPGPEVTSAAGAVVPGPFVFGPDTTVPAGSGSPEAPSGFEVRQEIPPAVAFGWYSETRYLAVVGRIFAAGGRRPTSLALRLHSPSSTSKRISIRCANGLRRDIDVRPNGTAATIPIAPGKAQSCWFGLTHGAVARVGRFNLSVKGSIRLVPRGS
jgi:hypothetical protein